MLITNFNIWIYEMSMTIKSSNITLDKKIDSYIYLKNFKIDLRRLQHGEYSKKRVRRTSRSLWALDLQFTLVYLAFFYILSWDFLDSSLYFRRSVHINLLVHVKMFGAFRMLRLNNKIYSIFIILMFNISLNIFNFTLLTLQI